MSKLPPIEKIHEAYSAIADGRVTMFDDENRALVESSSRSKTYTVKWNNNAYSSTDNGTHWQGYAGYPIIASLMLQGKLTLDLVIAKLFAGINWTELNKKHKRNYAAAVQEIITERNYDAAIIAAAVNIVYEELKKLDIVVKRKI
jgi:hypothetical protein